MSVKCLAQELNIMSLARAQTRNARARVERTNHEATAPSTMLLERGSLHQIRAASGYHKNEVLPVVE